MIQHVSSKHHNLLVLTSLRPSKGRGGNTPGFAKGVWRWNMKIKRQEFHRNHCCNKKGNIICLRTFTSLWTIKTLFPQFSLVEIISHFSKTIFSFPVRQTTVEKKEFILKAGEFNFNVDLLLPNTFIIVIRWKYVKMVLHVYNCWIEYFSDVK